MYIYNMKIIYLIFLLFVCLTIKSQNKTYLFTITDNYDLTNIENNNVIESSVVIEINNTAILISNELVYYVKEKINNTHLIVLKDNEQYDLTILDNRIKIESLNHLKSVTYN